MIVRALFRDVLAALGLAVPTLRLPNETAMRHIVKNHAAAMQAAERHAERTAEQQASNPKKAELREQRDRSVARIEEIARSLRDNR